MHALIGDVCGRGPAEAALGVCLRVAWRALVLAGQPPADVLSAVQLVLRHEQQDEAMFATVCMVSVAPDRTSGVLRLAGHPPPLLVTPDGITELTAPASPAARAQRPGELARPRGGARRPLVAAAVHRRADRGADRQGAVPARHRGPDGAWCETPSARRRSIPAAARDDALLDRLIDQVRDLNSGELDDDIAILALSRA